MTLFASADSPLRASSLPQLLRCPLRLYLIQKGVIIDGDNTAAHTGSMVHKGLEAFHANGFRVPTAIKAAKAGLHEYREADQVKAIRIIERYAADPRNRVKTYLLEEEVTYTLPPWKTDKTKEDIVIIGHCDQVREVDGQLCVVDYKTTSRSGVDALHAYTAQLVIYALAASKKLGKPVHPGYICRVTSYLTKQNDGNPSPDDVFIRYPFDLDQTNHLVDEIRREVARVRRDELGPRPSGDCSYCPAGHIGHCSGLLQNLTIKRK